MHGAADGDTGAGQGAIVYDRTATAAKFTSVTPLGSEFTLHQTGKVPAGGSTRFRFAYVQDYRAALVGARAKTASALFLNPITVSKSGKGTVTSSPAGIACGKTCTHRYAYGTSVTLNAKAARGSRFSGWSGACMGTGPCSVTMTADRSVTAIYDRYARLPECRKALDLWACHLRRVLARKDRWSRKNLNRPRTRRSPRSL